MHHKIQGMIKQSQDLIVLLGLFDVQEGWCLEVFVTIKTTVVRVWLSWKILNEVLRGKALW